MDGGYLHYVGSDDRGAVCEEVRGSKNEIGEDQLS